jgi:hypothetical protein
MPLDGIDFGTPPALDTGLFPIWSKHGCRVWIDAHARRTGRGRPTPASLRLPAPPHRQALTVRLLREARALIEDADGWTQGTYRSFRGRRCAIGALRAAARRMTGPEPAWAAHRLLINTARARGFASVEAMNDHSSHTAVLSAFDEAIGWAEAARG